jgi:hypothetical protein
MSRFALTTDTSIRSGLFRRTFEMSFGTRERQNQAHAAPLLCSLDDQVSCDRAYGRSKRRAGSRPAQHVAL